MSHFVWSKYSRVVRLKSYITVEWRKSDLLWLTDCEELNLPRPLSLILSVCVCVLCVYVLCVCVLCVCTVCVYCVCMSVYLNLYTRRLSQPHLQDSPVPAVQLLQSSSLATLELEKNRLKQRICSQHSYNIIYPIFQQYIVIDIV